MSFVSIPTLREGALQYFQNQATTLRKKSTVKTSFTLHASDSILLCGRIDAPENPKGSVVFTHGLCEHYGVYDYLTRKLNDAGYAVMRFDYRGHGRSMGKLAFFADRTQIVSDTELFVERMRSTFPALPLFMIGHSMGGFGAASYGTAHPGELAGYVLSSAWTRDHKGLAQVSDALPNSQYLPNKLDIGAIAEATLAEVQSEDPYVSNEFSVGLLRAVHEGHVWLREFATSFCDPVLFLHGGADETVASQDSIDMFEQIASTDKSLHIYAGLCHRLFLNTKRDRIILDTVTWLDDRVV